MLALLLAASMIVQPAPSSAEAAASPTAWLVASVGHSEWCPAGNVRLDLQTGRYALTRTAARRSCNQSGLQRPVHMGSLPADRLTALRAAHASALAEGMVRPACRNGGQPDRIIVSNGGARVLVVANGARLISASDNLSCWSDGASALHDVLEREFGELSAR